jgi:hypothetical protein
MWTLFAIELVRPRTPTVSDTVFEVSLHRTIGARTMRTNGTMTLRATKLSLSGAVSLTLTCLHSGRPKPLTGMMFREAYFV